MRAAIPGGLAPGWGQQMDTAVQKDFHAVHTIDGITLQL